MITLLNKPQDTRNRNRFIGYKELIFVTLNRKKEFLKVVTNFQTYKSFYIPIEHKTR